MIVGMKNMTTDEMKLKLSKKDYNAAVAVMKEGYQAIEKNLKGHIDDYLLGVMNRLNRVEAQLSAITAGLTDLEEWQSHIADQLIDRRILDNEY